MDFCCFRKTALDFDTEKAQAMGYIKSPYAQTLVAGFNVWQFDDEEDPVIKKREKPRVLQTITNIEDKEQDLFPCRDKNMIIGPISTQKPIEINQLSARFNATSIMSRFQDAPEFVPGRSLHTSHANLDDSRRLTPEPQSTQKKDVSIEKSASNKSLNVETENQKPSADRLPNMSFDELRILAAEMRKQKEKSAEAEEGKDENKEELKEKEEKDS
ncbi:unnamed protein product [Bursaphelenchus xylophilus]|uniref:(pine wood nematode) hypothetical protein n=1 Tax=Bursaphelenchus xylophilus TaxID=6326 RepID=A0A1I7SS31_BURXY|nr:unnamed protein product [Bursaphelenchus xylophilus]CAG9105741.1 unnamed protein product [Bursaphelenchus xylophilus]